MARNWEPLLGGGQLWAPPRGLLAAQAPLRLCSGAAQPRLMVKQRPLKVEALTGAGEKKSYVRLLTYQRTCEKEAENGASVGW